MSFSRLLTHEEFMTGMKKEEDFKFTLKEINALCIQFENVSYLVAIILI